MIECYTQSKQSFYKFYTSVNTSRLPKIQTNSYRLLTPVAWNEMSDKYVSKHNPSGRYRLLLEICLNEFWAQHHFYSNRKFCLTPLLKNAFVCQIEIFEQSIFDVDSYLWVVKTSQYVVNTQIIPFSRWLHSFTGPSSLSNLI